MTFDMSVFDNRDNGTPINEVFFCCRLPLFGMHLCNAEEESLNGDDAGIDNLATVR